MTSSCEIITFIFPPVAAGLFQFLYTCVSFSGEWLAIRWWALAGWTVIMYSMAFAASVPPIPCGSINSLVRPKIEPCCHEWLDLWTVPISVLRRYGGKVAGTKRQHKLCDISVLHPGLNTNIIINRATFTVRDDPINHRDWDWDNLLNPVKQRCEIITHPCRNYNCGLIYRSLTYGMNDYLYSK